MELTHTLRHEDKVKAIWVSICTFLRLYILGFISRNEPVFEGLTRAGTPFGGNCLTGKNDRFPAEQGVTQLPGATDATTHKSGEIELLDRPIDQVAVSTKKTEIGIHRHRSSPVLRNFGE